MPGTQSKRDALLDDLLKGRKTTKDVFGKHCLLKDMTKRLLEHALEGELTTHLGYAPHAAEGRGSGNSRNGKGKKHVTTESGQLAIEVPRDRDGSFEPRMVQKRQKRLEGFDDKIIWFYGAGQSTREIQAQLRDIYGLDVSPALISNVTNQVLGDVKSWRSRPLAGV